MKNDNVTIIRLPDDIKQAFKKQCEKELISMSVRIRQLILADVNKKKNEKT